MTPRDKVQATYQRLARERAYKAAFGLALTVLVLCSCCTGPPELTGGHTSETPRRGK